MCLSFIESLKSFFTGPTNEASPKPISSKPGYCTRPVQLEKFNRIFNLPGDHKDIQVTEMQEQMKANRAIEMRMRPLFDARNAVTEQGRRIAAAADQQVNGKVANPGLMFMLMTDLDKLLHHLVALTRELHDMLDVEMHSPRNRAWGAPAKSRMEEMLLSTNVVLLLHDSMECIDVATDALTPFRAAYQNAVDSVR